MTLIVEKSHPGVIVTDFGRYGYAHLGITTGGPADQYAFSWANYLLQNHIDCTVIEITLGQARFRITKPCWMAIAGADLQARLDGVALKNWSSFLVREGQQLEFKLPKNGLRAYLAVKNGFKVPKTLGSTSTVSRDKLGGVDHQGHALKAGDKLPFAKHSLEGSRQYVSFRFIPDYNRPIYLRVIEGYQNKAFSRQSLETFYQSEYQVQKDSNRMGYRLSGKHLTPPCDGIKSEGLALGAVQITPEGMPIVMLSDHQTIGGYPKIGTVSLVDLPRLGQAKPGQSVHFHPGDVNELQDAWCRWAMFFGY
ncbi:biotin-dependent carboxyltransferase family protein [Vibrio sp. WXL103]|uniref:5-oxoprolinase subunit C family protein n=1 Tax=unclassified Vibrio TaxID=2614977 RepID=UPI003EC83343